MGDWGGVSMKEARILFSQMKEEEIELIIKKILHWKFNTDKIQFAKHSMKRLKQKRIDEEEVIYTILKGDYIEFHYKDNGCRILIRKQRPNQTYDTCVIFDIISGTVVSAYLNASNDNHDTLHTEIYEEELDVISIINKCDLIYKGRC